MKKESGTIFSGSIRKSCAIRIIAILLCVSLVAGVIPTSAFALAGEEATVANVTAPDCVAYEVDAGTELAEAGLPAELEICLLIPAKTEGEAPVEQTAAAAVEWTGNYDKDTAGEYTLTAAFTDASLHFEPMPTVQVTVHENAPALQAPLENEEPGSGAKDENEGGVNYSAVCKLTPKKSAFSAGESIQFVLNAHYSTPGNPGAPRTVRFGIPIPHTTPEVSLPMFYMTGTGEYDGVPMYPLNYQGITIDLYLKTGSTGERWIEFNLDAGSTVQGVLSLLLPNGVSENVPAFTLTPVILSEDDYGTNTLLQSGTTAVMAEFGWNDVKKTANTENIGVIGATAKDPDRILYTVTADSQSSGIATGRQFTKRYVLTDTINLFGLHYADGVLTQSEANGVSTFSVDGTPVLEIAAPLSALNVDKQAAGGQITAFNLRYTVNNTTLGNIDGTAAELPNLNFSAALLLSAMQLNPGNQETKVTNVAEFDAYSLFGDHHHSEAAHTAYAQDRYAIEKAVYSDAECLNEITQVSADQVVWYKITATNNSAGNGPFSVTDDLPAGMTFVSAVPDISGQSGQTLTWSDVTIPSGESATFILKAKFNAANFVSNPVHNTTVLRKDGQRLASDYADVRYLAGVVDDASIIYEKNVDKTSAGQNDTLRYTISARNEKASENARRITITDKWPGENVRPTAITGCSDYALFDAANHSYTLQEAQSPSVVITKIELYNVGVPKGGGKATVYIDGVVTKPVLELKNVLVGSLGQNLTSTYSIGVSINKAAYKYDAANGIGEELTNFDAVQADDIVCYQMQVKNLTDLPITGAVVKDKLPTGLSPASVNSFSLSGQAFIKQGGGYTPLTLTPGTAQETFTPYTTSAFSLAAKETVTLYLFANVSEAAVKASNAGTNCITNAAYVQLAEGLVTGDATANIYTYVNTTQAFCIKKSIEFIADFDDDLQTATTRLLDREKSLLQWKKNDIVWAGAYVGYKIELINRNTTGANTDPVRVYELIDTLPQGMEFVGVCVKGDSNTYYIRDSAATALKNLGSQLIRDGETGTWSNSKYEAQEVSCRYDTDTNEVHITFNQGSSGVLPVKYHENGAATNLKPYFYLVARVKDDARQTLFRNTVDAKVANTVELNKMGDNKVTIRDGTGENESFKFISYYCDVNPIVFRPGIAKKLIGHYMNDADDPHTPETVQNGDGLMPGETLRFQVQTGAGVVSGSVSNRIHANLQDFVVTDYLPAEYVYHPGSAMVTLNATLHTRTGEIEENPDFAETRGRGTFEPTIDQLPDGRTKLTWVFSGKEYRLFCSLNNAYFDYFVHLITYDADWNTSYTPTYGNYTNTATVTHSYNFSSVYSGLPNYTDNTITATTVVNAFGAAGTAAVKAVTNADGKTVNGSDTTPYIPVSGPGARVYYSLKVTNATAADQKRQTKSLVIIDELPRATGDTGVVNRAGRGSEFSVLFDDTPQVYVYRLTGGLQIEVPSTLYTVRYGDSNKGLSSGGDWSDSESGGRIAWGKDSAGKNAIRIAFDSDFSLASGEAVLVEFFARAGGDASPGEIAWNSFGYTYQSLAEGELSEKIYAEPPRVGIYVPGAEIKVEKTISGDTAPAGARFTFLIKQDGTALGNVKYTLSGDSNVYYTGEDGSFTVPAAQTATLCVSPGSGYTVEEPAADIPVHYTFVSAVPMQNGDGTLTVETNAFDVKVLVKDDSAGVRYTNAYTAPPSVDITAEKRWAGDIDPNRPTSVSVQLYGNGTAEGTPVELSEQDRWSHTWEDLDDTVQWSVEEVSALPEGYSVEVTGDKTNGFIITNTYTRPFGELVVSKTVTGDLGDKSKKFTFTITFDSSDSYPYVGTESGTLRSGDTVQLAHGESITIQNLPAGTSYRVEESNNEGYAVSSTDSSGVIPGNSSITAAFVNRRGKVPFTGVDGAAQNGGWMTIVFTVGAAVLVRLVWFFRRRRRAERPAR